MARRLLAFDMKIIYYNRREISPAPDFPCTYVSSMDELLKQSDVVSLNLPLNDTTRGSFGKREFDLMKEGSALVNTARGAIVDEDALIEALETGRVSDIARLPVPCYQTDIVARNCRSRCLPR
jgi:glyoxylate reductase